MDEPLCDNPFHLEYHLAPCGTRVQQRKPVCCNRCKKAIPRGQEEFCWWCTAPLCWACWDEVGHCDHPEAEEINERLRVRIAASE